MAEGLKILYISHYFPPEVNAPAVRVSEMARCWATRGADVTILTGFPNHPTGIIPPEYRGYWRLREKRDGLSVVRTYVYAAPNRGFLKRVINFLSFMFSAVFIGTPMTGKPDIVIATSPQFFVAVAGYAISRIKRSRFVFEVRDLWPEEIVAVGALKNNLAIRILESIEMFLYRKADIIVAVAQGTIDVLKRRGVPESKIALIPNGVDIDLLSRGKGDAFRRELGFDDKFVVGYVGTHGMAHKLETVLEAARLLKDQADIRFLFVGDGAEKARLMALAADWQLDNVTFKEQVGRDRIPDIYAACELCLAPLRKADIFTKNIPSKIYEIMAAGRPIIISTEGESRALVEGAGAGLGAIPENAIDLASKISLLRADDKLRYKMGRSGFAFVLANSSRAALADSYLNLLYQATAELSATSAANKIEVITENNNRAKLRDKVSA